MREYFKRRWRHGRHRGSPQSPKHVPRNENMKVFVRNMQGSTGIYYLEQGPRTTGSSLKSKIAEREGIPVDLFLCKFGGKTLDGEGILEEWGVGDESVVQVCGRLLGGSAVTFEFASLKNGYKRAFVSNAPDHRLISPGLNLEGKCVNSKCSVCGEYVWSNMGFKSAGKESDKGSLHGFNMDAAIRMAPCPLCQTWLDPLSVLSCGFHKCEYEYEGRAMGSGEVFKGKKRVDEEGGFEFHDGHVDKRRWGYLTISVKRLQ